MTLHVHSGCTTAASRDVRLNKKHEWTFYEIVEKCIQTYTLFYF